MKGMLKAPSLGVLSQREREVLRLAAEGCTDTSICTHLGIAPGTLGTYWTRVRNKTGLSSRTELAAAYVRHRCEGVLVKTVAIVAERWVRGGGNRAEESQPPSMASEVFEAIPIAALVVKADGEIVALNQMAVRVLEQRPKTGSSLKRHLSAHDVPGFVHGLRASLNGKGSARFQANILVPSGIKECHWLAKPLVPHSRMIVLLLSESETGKRTIVAKRH